MDYTNVVQLFYGFLVSEHIGFISLSQVSFACAGTAMNATNWYREDCFVRNDVIRACLRCEFAFIDWAGSVSTPSKTIMALFLWEGLIIEDHFTIEEPQC